MASWHMKKNFEKGVEGWRGIWKIVRTSGKNPGYAPADQKKKNGNKE